MIPKRSLKVPAVKSAVTEVGLMFSAICFILLIMVFFKLLGVAFKVGWGILKIIICLIFFPIIAVSLIIAGLAVIALPLILIAGIAGFVTKS